MPRMRVRLFYRLPIAVLAFLVVGSIPVRAGTFTAFGPKTYVRQTGTPVTVTDTFSAVDPSVHYSLRVTNSRAASGKDEEVSRAFVTINGVQVIDPSQFGHTLSVVQVAVPLLASNQIAVRVLGAPGGAITVEIIGGMVGSFTALGPKVYQRGDDDSVAIINMFSVADPSLQYVLRVTNSKLPVDPETDGKEGTDDERSGVSRTLITINGIRVVSPVSFGHIVSTLEVPILLQTSNQIGVEVRGKQGGKITVEISGGLVGPFSVFGAKTYRKDTKDSDDPQSVRDTFSVANPGAPYTLLLANSSIHGLSDKDDDSEKGVSKATVS